MLFMCSNPQGDERFYFSAWVSFSGLQDVGIFGTVFILCRKIYLVLGKYGSSSEEPAVFYIEVVVLDRFNLILLILLYFWNFDILG